MDIFSAFAKSGARRSLSPPLVRAFGGALSRMAPAQAARLAARIWSTLPPRRRGSTTVEGSVPLRLDMGGRTALGHQWEVSGNGPFKVLVQHGWGGSVAQMSGPIRALVDAGATVLAFDAFGHGATGPGRHGRRRSSLIELGGLIEAIDQQFGPFTAVVSHSAACPAVARAMRKSLHVERAVFLAPLVDPLGQSHLLSEALGLSATVARAWPDLLLSQFGSSRADIDMTIPPPPARMPLTLIFQDRDDRLSPPAGARQLHRAWAGSRLIETSGLGHYRLQADPAVLTTMAQFVVANEPFPREHLIDCLPAADLAVAPCGADAHPTTSA